MRKTSLPLILTAIICCTSSLHAAIYDESDTDITATPITQVQDSQSKSLALPNRLIENEYNIFFNPAHITDKPMVYFDGWSGENKIWGGGVLALPADMKLGAFLRRPLSPTSPLLQSAKEPRTGNTESFANMVKNGSTTLGVVDPTSIYFKSNTVFKSSDSPSQIALGNDDKKGFGNMDLLWGIKFSPLSIGTMFSYNHTEKNESDNIPLSSHRSLAYSADEYRFTLGANFTAIGPILLDTSFSYAKYKESYSYSAYIDGSYTSGATQSESLKCSSGNPSEISALIRVIYPMDTSRIIGTMSYIRSSFPITISGKLASASAPATHSVIYDNQSSTFLFDLAYYKKANDLCTIVFSSGIDYFTEKLSKKTSTTPAATDGSIWGDTPINEHRTTTMFIVPAGIASEYKAFEKVGIRLGIRKYIFAPYNSSYKGSSTSGKSKGEFTNTDQLFASAGIYCKPIDNLSIDFVVETSYFSLSRNGGDDKPVLAGFSMRYSY